jgi:hypothetical protein
LVLIAVLEVFAAIEDGAPVHDDRRARLPADGGNPFPSSKSTHDGAHTCLGLPIFSEVIVAVHFETRSVSRM